MQKTLMFLKQSCSNSLQTFKCLVVALPMIAATTTSAVADSSPDELSKFAEVYLWGASVGGSTAAGDDIDVGFSDLVKDLKMGFMGAFGASKGKWSFLADVIYLDLDDKTTHTRNIDGLATQIDIDTELTGWVVQAMGGYNLVRSDRYELNAVAGVRYLDLNTKLRLKFNGESRPRRSVSGDLWDGIIGLRGKANLSEKWYLSGHLDIGTGDSDVTWQGLAVAGYRFSKADGVFGYRYLDWNLDGQIDDLNFHGPFAGVMFSL